MEDRNMSRILYVKSSPRGDRSYSNKVASAFLESYLQSHPKDRVKTIDLFNARLPSFDGYVLDAKYAILHGQSHTSEQKKAWAQVEKIIKQFERADKYVFSMPMWNFGIPYRLKHYIDVITQPGYTFSFTPQDGYKGLVTGKPAVTIYSRGGEYAPGTPGEASDFQKRYFEHVLGFMGFTDVRSIVVECTLYGPEAAEASKRDAIEKARKMAIGF